MMIAESIVSNVCSLDCIYMTCACLVVQVPNTTPARFRLTRPGTGRLAKTTDVTELQSRSDPHRHCIIPTSCTAWNVDAADEQRPGVKSLAWCLVQV